MYRSLDAGLIVATVCQLERRVRERFPQSGLAKVAAELNDVAHQAKRVAAAIDRPQIGLRVVCGVIIAMVAIVVIAAVVELRLAPPGEWTWMAVIPALESVTNELILLGAGLFFLITLEDRIKRRRALKAIHELRSLAHVIDMHQLTKDPQGMLERTPTPASPTRKLSPYQLSRYLDYCSEMLSLIGKLAALYVQHFDDSVALAAVDGMEDLTNGLSRKIWQKIAMIEAAARTERLLLAGGEPAETGPTALGQF